MTPILAHITLINGVVIPVLQEDAELFIQNYTAIGNDDMFAIKAYGGQSHYIRKSSIVEVVVNDLD